MSNIRFSNSSRVKQIIQERFNNLKWTPDEIILRDRPNHVKDFFKGRKVPFHILEEVKLKRSLFGPFLEIFNFQQHQDQFLNENKLSILDYNFKSLASNEFKNVEDNNNFIEDVYKLLQKAVDENEVIDSNFLFENIYALRFMDTPLTFLDDEMRKFKNLRILILCGNWITDITGNDLPRNLEYIELFANQIEHVVNFVKKVPKTLLHIGLRRNWLTDRSQLHLLGKPKKFQYLRSLDLSENDIYELEEVLHGLATLPSLLALQLQGNPCSVINTYKDDILKTLPELSYLDNTEIIEDDRELNPHEIETTSAIIFTCHRIINLPAPPKEKGIIHTFQFEISMPLLEEVIIPPDSMPSLTEVDVKDNHDKKAKKGKPEKKSKGSSNKSKTSGATSIYDGPNEWTSKHNLNALNTSFKSERFAWSKMIQLPEDAIIIKSQNGNLTDIRDTFRSSVNIKLVYYKILPPQIKKKGKKKDKKDKKDKKKNKESKIITELIEAEPTETILTKITLANFWCDLHSINWSDQFLDFYWAQHSKCHKKAFYVDGSLRAMQYKSAGDKKKGKDSEKSSERQNTGDLKNKISSVLPLPNIFTIQVGIGLQRDYIQ